MRVVLENESLTRLRLEDILEVFGEQLHDLEELVLNNITITSLDTEDYKRELEEKFYDEEYSMEREAVIEELPIPDERAYALNLTTK
jgi:hypothetical protein